VTVGFGVVPLFSSSSSRISFVCFSLFCLFVHVGIVMCFLFSVGGRTTDPEIYLFTVLVRSVCL
jgi:hypothetical protein